MPFDFKAWYAEHGEDLNRRRRERYGRDAEYRQQVLRTNEGARERRRVVDDALRREELREAVVAPSRWKAQEIEVGGEVVQVYSIGSVAKILGYSVQIVRKWEREGRLPPAVAKNAKGDRLFTLEQLQLIRELAKRQGLGAHPRSRFRPTRYIVRLASGEEVVTELCRVGELAKALRRAVLTLGQMERAGTLPGTTLRYRGRRLYTPEMVMVAGAAMEEQAWKLRGERAERFRSAVVLGWEALGVVGAVVVSEWVEQEGEDDGKGERSGSRDDDGGAEVLRAGG